MTRGQFKSGNLWRKKAIKGSAEGVAVVFLKLADLHQQSVEEYKTLLDSIDEKSLKLGTFIDNQAQRGADYDETWKLLITSVILGTYAIVEADPTTGLMSGLALTPAERDQILAELRSTFGQQVTGGMQAGQSSLVAAASALYGVIGDSKRQPREPR